jgi:hypothetical protein
MEALFGGGLGVSTDEDEMNGVHRSPELDWGACQCGMTIEDWHLIVPLNILLVKNSAGFLDCKPYTINCLEHWWCRAASRSRD